MILKRKKIIYLLTIFLIISIDQLTKYSLVNYLDYFLNREVLLFNIDYVLNDGAAFNIFSGNKLFLSSISITTSLFLIYFIFFTKNIIFLEKLGLCFILGGSIGNGIDRISKGYVIDFINLNFINFPVFNIADICINIGFILLIYQFCKSYR